MQLSKLCPFRQNLTFLFGIKNWLLNTRKLGRNKGSGTVNVSHIWYCFGFHQSDEQLASYAFVHDSDLVDSTTGVVWSPTRVGPGTDTLSSVYSWWNALNCIHTYTLTTPRSTASVDPGTPTVYGNVLLTVSLPSLIGCVPIDFSSMHPRRKYCGELQPVDSQLPSDPLAVGSDIVSPVRCVRDLGIFIDADQTMRTQVSQTCSKCFAAHQQLRSIRRSVSNDVMQSLIVALVFSRLDCGSATLAGLPKQLMDRLQSVQNAAARLIFNACRQDHIQPLLRRLHWLRIPERVLFRLALLVYRCLHGSAPGYLASDLQRVSHLNACRRLRSSTTSALVAPRTVRFTIGDHTYPATAASVWNSLPESARSSPSLQVFRSRLKTELFVRSYRHD